MRILLLQQRFFDAAKRNRIYLEILKSLLQRLGGMSNAHY